MDKKKNIQILTTQSFTSICRFCLNQPEVLYEVADISFENECVRDIIHNCISLKVEDDELPNHICETCTRKVCDIHTFKTLCLDADLLLKNVLQDDSCAVKEEPLDLEGEIIIKGGDNPCPECPTPSTLPNNLKQVLIRSSRASHLCASCGSNYDIELIGCSSNAIKTEEQDILTKASFDIICRTCLAKPDVMYQILDISFENIPIKELLEDYISIKVDEKDELPQHICEPCTARLCGIYTFKKTCFESESLLHKTLKYDLSLIKVEEEDDDDADVDFKDVLPIIKSDLDSDLDSDNSKKDVSDDKSVRICVVCNQVVPRQSYWKHKQLHYNAKRKFRCSKCPAAFSLQCNLKRHVMIHTGERPHLCDFCGKSFIQANTLIEHKRIHTGEKPYQCRNCGKQWSQYSSYKNHMDKPNCSGMVKHGTNKYDCNECCGRFKSKHELKDHNCDDTPLNCRVCGREFITRNALKIHVRTHNGPKHYTCSICNEDFSIRQMFTRHMSRHRVTEHICNECGKGFSNYSGLWSHRKVHTGEQPYSCTICNRAFSQAGSLKSHMLIHTGEKPFSCEICHKTFTQPNHLKYHLRTHSGEKPYTCKYCGKSFSLNGTLTVHMRIHTGETPYHCEVCNKGFYDSSSMKKHRRKHDMPDHNMNSSSRKRSEYRSSDDPFFDS